MYSKRFQIEPTQIEPNCFGFASRLLKSRIIKDKDRIISAPEKKLSVFFNSKCLKTFKKPWKRQTDLRRRSKMRRFSCKPNVQFWLNLEAPTVVEKVKSEWKIAWERPSALWIWKFPWKFRLTIRVSIRNRKL